MFSNVCWEERLTEILRHDFDYAQSIAQDKRLTQF